MDEYIRISLIISESDIASSSRWLMDSLKWVIFSLCLRSLWLLLVGHIILHTILKNLVVSLVGGLESVIGGDIITEHDWALMTFTYWLVWIHLLHFFICSEWTGSPLLLLSLRLLYRIVPSKCEATLTTYINDKIPTLVTYLQFDCNLCS